MDAPTAPWVGFVESSAADNDDWITDHAGDPDLITWTDYTEGTEALVFNNVISRRITAIPGNTAEVRSGGHTYEHRIGKRRYSFQYTFKVMTRAEVNNCLKFPMLERHTELNAPFVDFYLIDLQAANDHITFVDADNNVKSYCKVHIQQLQEVWTDATSNKHVIMVSGVSAW